MISPYRNIILNIYQLKSRYVSKNIDQPVAKGKGPIGVGVSYILLVDSSTEERSQRMC